MYGLGVERTGGVDVKSRSGEKRKEREQEVCAVCEWGERKEAIDIKREWEKDESREIRETKI